HHIHSSKNSQRPFRELNLHGSWLRNETAPVHSLSALLTRDSYRQEVGRRAQPSFVIELPPVEHLIGIHVVPSCHSRDRGSRHQRLFYNRPRSALVRHRCFLPGSSTWWECLSVSTILLRGHIILIYIVGVHTVGTGRLRLCRKSGVCYRMVLKN